MEVELDKKKLQFTNDKGEKVRVDIDQDQTEKDEEVFERNHYTNLAEELDEKEIKGFYSIIKKIKPKQFDQSYIFSDSIRFYLISKLSGINKNFQYKFFSKKGNCLFGFVFYN